MIEFIIGAVAGIYTYKKVKLVQNIVDTYLVDGVKNAKRKFFEARYKIVDFGSDNYAIRHFAFLSGYEYKDLTTKREDFWWTIDNRYFKECLSDLKTCAEAYEKLRASGKSKNYGIPLK